MFKFDYEKLAEYLPGSFMPTDEVLARIEQYMNEAHTQTIAAYTDAPPLVYQDPQKFRKLTYAEMVEVSGKYLLQKHVWIPTRGGNFSNSWPAVESLFAVADKAIEEHTEAGIKLVRYSCENDDRFEFNNNMRLP